MKKNDIIKKQVLLLVCLLCFVPFISLANAGISGPQVSIKADKTCVMPSNPVAITVSTAYAIRLTINGVIKSPSSGGTFIYTPTTTTTYTAVATDAQSQTASKSVTVYMYPTVSLTVSPPTITSGSSATISWSTSDATTATLSDGTTTLSTALRGSKTITPTTRTTYTLTASNPAGGTGKLTAVINVNPSSGGGGGGGGSTPKPTITFTSSNSIIDRGGSSTLSWNVKDATSVSINNGVSTGNALIGNYPVSPTETTTYILTATGPGGTNFAPLTIQVNEPVILLSLALELGKSIIDPGETTYIKWSSTGYSSVIINGINTDGRLSGQVDISPNSTTTYIAYATGGSGGATDSKEVTLTVTSTPAPEQQATIRLSLSKLSISTPTSITVSWVATNANTIEIDNGIYSGSNLTGSKIIDVSKTTTFTALAFGSHNTETTSATVTFTGIGGQDFFSTYMLPILLILAIIIICFVLYYYYRKKKGTPITFSTISYRVSTTFSKLKLKIKKKPNGGTSTMFSKLKLRLRNKPNIPPYVPPTPYDYRVPYYRRTTRKKVLRKKAHGRRGS